MWSKKTYDILAVIFILSLVGVYFANSFINIGVDLNQPISKTNQLNMNTFVKGMALQNLFLSIPIGIYGILVIILAIQMHKKDFISLGDVILIVLFSPLAIIWYIFVLRKHFKKVLGNTMVVQSPPITQ